jgi:lysozyme
MQLTPRAVAYLATEEGIACESYLDSATPPNWTWAMGLTAAAGANVQAYVNRPAPLAECIRASIDRLNAAYLPAINSAFAGHPLNDAQLAAALSFHWNTGAIGRAHWVNDWNGGAGTKAITSLTENYLNGGQLRARRKREAALFFTGQWPADMRCPVWQVSKPGHRPVRPVPTDIMPILQQIMGGN